MKYFYMAVTIEQDKNELQFGNTEHEYQPGLYAYVVKFPESDNVKSVMERIGGLKYANMCHTKKGAESIVDFWNASYKANGSYLFDNPAF